MISKIRNDSRHNNIIALRATGLSYAEIGRLLGISRERVRQIIIRKSVTPKPSPESKIMLRIGDVAKILGLHSNTVRRWAQKGILKNYRIGSRGDRRFRREDIDAFLNRSTEDYSNFE